VCAASAKWLGGHPSSAHRGTCAACMGGADTQQNGPHLGNPPALDSYAANRHTVGNESEIAESPYERILPPTCFL
jgi:hypothetical protein